MSKNFRQKGSSSLNIIADELLLPIEIIAEEARTINKKLELANKQGVTTDSGEIYSENPKMLRDLDSNQGDSFQRAASYH